MLASMAPSGSTAQSTPTTDAAPLAREYRALTERCGIVDRSERGKLALTGGEAGEFLNGQVTNDILALLPGQGCYAAFLTHKGKMLGDLRVLATEEELLLDTERVALQALFDTIRRFKIGYDVDLHKRTLQTALLSLMGPGAEHVVAAALAADPGLAPIRVHVQEPGLAPDEHCHVPARLGGVDVRLVRTDTGVDVLCDADAGPAVRQALIAGGAEPVSEAVAEIVRVEQGRPRYGVDMDNTTIPQEAGLNERAVSFTKGCYVGQETVARLHYKGKPNRLLRGLRLSEPVDAGAELALGERAVGRLTSSVLSPRFGPIGLGLVRVQAQPGDTVSVGEHGATARVCELPFA
jgi:folate-binding protein YgfZ